MPKTQSIELLKINDGRMIELREEYCMNELIEAGFLGSRSKIWKRMLDRDTDGRKKEDFEILKFEDRAMLAGKQKKRIFTRQQIKEYIKANHK